MERIEVYVDENENDPNNINEVHIGDIVSKEGKLTLSIVATGKAASILQKAFVNITSRKSLQSRTDKLRRIDGEDVHVSTRIDVSPDPNNPQYIWAIARTLEREYGFNCDVVCIGEEN
ncbi:MAG: hypothetical protein ABH886_00575 [Candidatus Desantisbacteria bacterium]